MTDEGAEDRVSLDGLDPAIALKALLAVDPDAPPVKAEDDSQSESDEHEADDQ